MSSTPNLASIVVLPESTQISAANTNRDGTGTTVLVATGTTNACVIERATITATGTTTEGMIRFFISIDGGTTKRLFCEVNVRAVTPSASLQAFTVEVDKLVGMALLTNCNIYAATNNAETFNVIVEKAQT